MSVTNTTAGKKAPGIKFDLSPLYPRDSFGDSTSFSKYGPLTKELHGDAASKDIGVAIKGSYINPFSHSSEKSSFGTIPRFDFRAGIAKPSGGSPHIGVGEDFQVGETRSLDCGIESFALSTDPPPVLVAEVETKYASQLKNVSAWAVAPISSSLSADVPMVFGGEARLSTGPVGSYFVYTYDPTK